MVTALHSDCQGPSFNPWSGNRSHEPCGMNGKKKKKGMKSPLKCGRKRGYGLRGKEPVIMVCAYQVVEEM